MHASVSVICLSFSLYINLCVGTSSPGKMLHVSEPLFIPTGLHTLMLEALNEMLACVLELQDHSLDPTNCTHVIMALGLRVLNTALPSDLSRMPVRIMESRKSKRNSELAKATDFKRPSTATYFGEGRELGSHPTVSRGFSRLCTQEVLGDHRWCQGI